MILVMLSCNHIPDVSFLEVLLHRRQRYSGACALVRELVPLCAGSACAVRANPPREALEKSGPKSRFPANLFALGLAQRVLGSLAFAAVL